MQPILCAHFRTWHAQGWQHVNGRQCLEVSPCIALMGQCEEALEGRCLEGVSLKVCEGPGSTSAL